MVDNLNSVQVAIDRLAEEVRQGSFGKRDRPQLKTGWRRAGVLFATEVPSPGEGEGGGRRPPLTVVTPHAAEAGWLLDRLYASFRPLLDECIERDFFERLGEAALEYCGYVDPADSTGINLLKIILAEAGDVLDEMREGEFPCVA